jgi:hypothetical protein
MEGPAFSSQLPIGKDSQDYDYQPKLFTWNLHILPLCLRFRLGYCVTPDIARHVNQ